MDNLRLYYEKKALEAYYQDPDSSGSGDDAGGGEEQRGLEGGWREDGRVHKKSISSSKSQHSSQ